MNRIKRAVVLVHYDRDDIVDEYLYEYIKALQLTSTHLVFVSTAKLNDFQIEKLTMRCNTVIVRDNIGYDFMSYKVGLESFDYKAYDEVLLCNDSVYGPLYPMQNLFDTMENQKCDFWGITDNTDMGYHIQSYFLLLKKPVLESAIFSTFWKSVKVLDKKDDIIKQYEVGFSQQLIQHNFTPAVSTHFHPTTLQKMAIFVRKFTPTKIVKKIYSLLNGKAKIVRIGKINTTHYFWKDLLLSGNVPFIKIELLRDNPMNVKIEDYQHIIEQVSEYDTNLIRKHLARMKRI